VTRIHVVDQPECSIQRRFAINWADTLAIPVYLTSASALSLALTVVLRSPRARRIRAQLLRSRDTYFLNEPVLEVEEATQTMGGLATVAKEHVIRHGEICIYSFKVATFVGCLGLLCLSIVTWALDTRRKLDVGVRETPLFILSARFSELSGKEWVQLSEMFNFVGVRHLRLRYSPVSSFIGRHTLFPCFVCASLLGSTPS
jgi:hypothetical protein